MISPLRVLDFFRSSRSYSMTSDIFSFNSDVVSSPYFSTRIRANFLISLSLCISCPLFIVIHDDEVLDILVVSVHKTDEVLLVERLDV